MRIHKPMGAQSFRSHLKKKLLQSLPTTKIIFKSAHHDFVTKNYHKIDDIPI